VKNTAVQLLRICEIRSADTQDQDAYRECLRLSSSSSNTLHVLNSINVVSSTGNRK